MRTATRGLNTGEATAWGLAPDGWIKGLEAAGKLCDEKTSEALGSLCAKIKHRCEDGGLRHRSGTTIQELSAETGIPQGWISNVIDSHLIGICFQQVDCEWDQILIRWLSMTFEIQPC